MSDFTMIEIISENLIGISAAFAAAYALISCVFDAFEDLSGGRVRKLEETNPKLAGKLDAWQENGELFRACFKLLLFICAGGITVCLWTGAVKAAPAAGYPVSLVFAVFAAAAVFLLCVICDSAAKLLLPSCDLYILRAAMPVINAVSKVLLSPMLPLYKYIARKAEKLRNGGNPDEKATLEDEILDLMEDEPDGQLEEGEKRMIRGIFDLQDKSVREIMTPRVAVEAIPLSATIEEAKDIIVRTGHSRIPAYGRSIDEIKGILYAKDFIDVPDDKRSLSGMLHNPIFIPETKAVDELLEEIKRSHNHFAVIIDEYGGTSGIVTFEDIIEEIVGDIRDEFDSAEDASEKPQLMPDGSVMLEAQTPLDDVNEILGIEIPQTDDADTIGGYICSELGRIPEKGEVFSAPGLFSAVVADADKRRIIKLKISASDDDDE